MRIIIIGTVAEFRGELVNVIDNDEILGYNLQEVLDTLFKGTPGQYVYFVVTPSTKLTSSLTSYFSVTMTREF